jgi:hypothetical protein
MGGRRQAQAGPGRLARAGQSGGGGPLKPKIPFSFIINFSDFLNRFKFKI